MHIQNHYMTGGPLSIRHPNTNRLYSLYCRYDRV